MNFNKPLKEVWKYICFLVLFFVFCSVSFVKAEETKENFIILHPLYGQKKLVVDVDISKKMNLTITDEIDVELSSAETGLIEKRKIKPIAHIKPENRKYQTVFDMKKLSNGVYNIKVVVRDEYGDKLMDEYVKEFTWLSGELEKFKWLGSKAGISEEVLAPWTPIEVKQKGNDLIVKVWGREYHFENSIFPTKIETKGSSILASKIQVTGKVDGKNVSLRFGEVKIEKQIPSLICFTQKAKGKGLILSSKTQIEYDGMIKIDWKLTSERDLKLDELTFEIPIKEKNARYMYTKGYVKCGYIPKDRRVIKFEPLIWLGDEELGLQWFCESYKDWYNIEEKKSIEILPQKDVVMFRLHLVDKQIVLKPGKRIEHELGIPIMQPEDNVNELSYTFGLQATPVKPVTKDVWDYRFIHIGAGSPSLDVPVGRYSGEKFNIKESNLDPLIKHGVKTLVYHENWTDAFSSTSTPYEKELKNLVKNCHDRGIQFLLYIGMAIADTIPEWQLFNEECVRMSRNVWTVTWEGWTMPPHSASDFCLKSVWSDYLADGLARIMMDEYNIDGLYLDGTTTTAGGCKNVLHGCGYVSLDGNVRRTYALFAGREMIRRFYTIIKQRKPDGQVNLHNSTEMFSPVLSWVTSYWNGEHLGVVMASRGLSKKSTILQKMPLDYFRTEFMGHQWGVPAEFLEYHFTDDYAQEVLSLSLLHDVPIRLWYAVSPIWKLMDEFGRKESEWLPYWKNSEYVNIKPEGKDVYISLYKHPKNGVLGIVSNLGESDVEKVIVQLNLKKLKLKDKEKLFSYMMTVGRDNIPVVDEPKPVNMVDGTFSLSLPSRGWKLIWVKPKVEEYRASQNAKF